MTTRTLHFLPLFALLAITLGARSQAEDFKVSDLTFTKPEKWKTEKPSSRMRAAQFSVGADDNQGQVVFFYFGAGGAGGVEANIKRWIGQFKEPADQVNAKTEVAKVGDIKVHYVSAEGTFLSGPPRGPKVEKPGQALLGAIIEAKAGAIFAKFTGPKALVTAATEDFKKMIGSAK